MSEIAIVVLGSNIGDRVGYLAAGLDAIEDFCEVTRIGSLYESEPFGVEDQGRFLNSAVAIETELSPHSLLRNLKDIEKRIGRRSAKRWGPREIDLDIALFGDVIIDDDALTVPHAGLEKRDFFLEPIIEIMPDAVNPRTGETLDMILNRFPQKEKKIISKSIDDRWQVCIT